MIFSIFKKSSAVFKGLIIFSIFFGFVFASLAQNNTEVSENWVWSGLAQTSTSGAYGFFGALFFDFFSCPRSVGCHYSKRAALANPTITANYYAKIFNVTKGTYVGEGDEVDIGDNLDFSAALSGVSWVGTGYAVDTPIGYLVPNAGPPGAMCSSQDEINSYYGTCVYKSFVSLSVNPPPSQITHSGTASLSCNGNGTLCEVVGPGEIINDFTVASTYGKFYHQWSRYNGSNPGFCAQYGPNGCFANDDPTVSGSNDPLTYCPGETFSNFDQSQPGYSFYAVRVDSASCSPFQVSIPEQNRTIKLIARALVATNEVPVLVVSAPEEIPAETPATITLTATDPDGDNVHYVIDWDGNQVGDVWLPTASSYVSEGTSQTITRTWITEGVVKFWAKARDDKGGESAWQEKSIKITNDTGTNSGSCGDGIKNGTEECDGGDFGGLSCQSFGFSQGSLSCRPNCSVNTSACSNTGGNSCVEQNGGVEICGNGIDEDCNGSDLQCTTSGPTCNKNTICERSRGENFFNCSDCRGIFQEL